MTQSADQAVGSSAASQAAGVDPARFREAMSRVAAAVHIVTTDGAAGLGGITATAVTSITVEPPMMLFCINKTSPSAARLIENGVFCINALAPAHEALSNVFAGRTDQRLEERFTTGEWAKLATGAPALKGAVASFDCRLVETNEVTTHLIVIGAVEAVEFGPEGEGLAYVHRKYKAI
ncbi:flavin reductase family protein [Methylocapsa acidiphila]|uniref:flavin reductase family protein n=1 Tax=Methylocapsa acidiphila TaxID=133552 RepID=UPI00040B25DB|nr:flavin reductase family protein [Methylocapsa acidiphila]